MFELFEALMIGLLGVSWAINVIKSLRAKTAKNKSLLFLCLVLLAYLCGVISKILADHITYVFGFYIANCVLVSTDIILLFRNKSYDRKKLMVNCNTIKSKATEKNTQTTRSS